MTWIQIEKTQEEISSVTIFFTCRVSCTRVHYSLRRRCGRCLRGRAGCNSLPDPHPIETEGWKSGGRNFGPCCPIRPNTGELFLVVGRMPKRWLCGLDPVICYKWREREAATKVVGWVLVTSIELWKEMGTSNNKKKIFKSKSESKRATSWGSFNFYK